MNICKIYDPVKHRLIVGGVYKNGDIMGCLHSNSKIGLPIYDNVSTNNIQALPDDMLKNILTRGTLATYASSRMVCRRWRLFSKEKHSLIFCYTPLPMQIKRSSHVSTDIKPRHTIITNDSSMIIVIGGLNYFQNIICGYKIIDDDMSKLNHVWCILSTSDDSDVSFNTQERLKQYKLGDNVTEIPHRLKTTSICTFGSNFIVSDSESHTLLIFNMNGKLIDKLYDHFMIDIKKIVTSGNHCYVLTGLKVYLWELGLNSFCSKRLSKKNGKNYWKHLIKNARCVEVVNDIIYILDLESIKCFTKSGQLKKNINIKLNYAKNDQMWYIPYSISVYNDLLYVSYLGTIRILTLNGELITKYVQRVSSQNICHRNIFVHGDNILVTEGNQNCIFSMKQISNLI